MNAFVEEFKKQQDVNYSISESHGFDVDYEHCFNLGEKIALAHGELSEALESYRCGDDPSDHIPDFSGVEEELADAVIRIMNIATAMKLRLPEAMLAKQAFNNTRPYMHGNKRF